MAWEFSVKATTVITITIIIIANNNNNNYSSNIYTIIPSSFNIVRIIVFKMTIIIFIVGVVEVKELRMVT